MYGFRVRTWRTTTPPPIVGPTDFMRVLRKKREKRKMCFHVFTFPILGERYTGWGSRYLSDTRIYKIKTPAVHSCNNIYVLVCSRCTWYRGAESVNYCKSTIAHAFKPRLHLTRHWKTHGNLVVTAQPTLFITVFFQPTSDHSHVCPAPSNVS